MRLPSKDRIFAQKIADVGAAYSNMPTALHELAYAYADTLPVAVRETFLGLALAGIEV